MTRRRGRRRKKLLDDLKDRRGYSHLKEEAWIALCGGIVLEEALDLSSDSILNNNNILPIYSYESRYLHALNWSEINLHAILPPLQFNPLKKFKSASVHNYRKAKRFKQDRERKGNEYQEHLQTHV